MADEDESSRTEEPSGRRLAKAREQGQVAQSQDVKAWAGLAASVLVLSYLLPTAANKLARTVLPFIDHPDRMSAGLSDASGSFVSLLADVFLALAPSLGALAFCALAASLGQAGLIWAPSKIAPDFNRISPLSGAKRLISLQALVDFFKSLVKIVVIAAAIVAAVAPVFRGIDLWLELPVASATHAIHHELVKLAGTAAALMTAIAVLDYGLARFRFMRSMRMTRQEVQEEHKQAEGDPHIKGRLRRLRQERARQRMMAAVPKATVVITNPTHFAVALGYEMTTMAAPKVVAKGVDDVALRIRTLAQSHGVPVVENPPLARLLHATVDLNEDIPAEHYQAVARVIGYVMRLQAERGR